MSSVKANALGRAANFMSTKFNKSTIRMSRPLPTDIILEPAYDFVRVNGSADRMLQNKITVVAFHVVCKDGTPLVLGVEEVQAKFSLNLTFPHVSAQGGLVNLPSSASHTLQCSQRLLQLSHF